jgi:hypothetical protein
MKDSHMIVFQKFCFIKVIYHSQNIHLIVLINRKKLIFINIKFSINLK